MCSNGYVVTVCVRVCVSVKSHLTSGASVCPENATMYSAGNEGKYICGDFRETYAFQRLSAPSLGGPYIRLAISCQEHACALCIYKLQGSMMTI